MHSVLLRVLLRSLGACLALGSLSHVCAASGRAAERAAGVPPASLAQVREVHFHDVAGRHRDRGIQLPAPAADNEWHFIEGATQARITVVFDRIRKDEIHDGFVILARVNSFSAPFLPWSRPPIVGARLVNEEEERTFLIAPQGIAADSERMIFRVPRKVIFSVNDTTDQEGDVFENFAVDGRIVLEIEVLDAKRFVGFAIDSFALRRPNERKASDSRDTEAEPEAGKSPPTLSAAEGYSKALEAVRQAWTDYESALFQFSDGARRRTGILTEDELRIRESYRKRCIEILAGMPQNSKDPQDWLYVGLVRLLADRQDVGEAMERAVSLGVKGSEAHSYLGLQHLAAARLAQSSKYLQEALEREPDNALAFAAMEFTCRLIGRPLPKSVKPQSETEALKEARQQFRDGMHISGTGGQNRTLPWKFILPVESKLRKLTRVERRAEPVRSVF